MNASYALKRAMAEMAARVSGGRNMCRLAGRQVVMAERVVMSSSLATKENRRSLICST
jgi:hypothetical protein